MSAELPRAILKPKEELRVIHGHPWIYDNELRAVEGEPRPGDLVECRDSRGRAFAWGWWNPDSRIRIRVVSREPLPRDGYARALAAAAMRRREGRYDLSRRSARLAFGEADSLPGLVADQFVDARDGSRHVVLQLLSRGAAARRDEIADAYAELCGAASVIERSDASVLALEGLEPRVEVLRGKAPERVEIEENGLRFAVDPLGGQKTGWFLDQRENRAAAASWMPRGARCLDAFSHLGGFALNLAAAGAESVLAVDVSERAVEGIRANAALNDLGAKVDAVRADCFDFLAECQREGREFDLVVLDPPAFAKRRDAADAAARGYKEINLRAMRMLRPGGVLVTCTCSFQFSREAFYRTVEYAARDARRRFELLEQRTQAPDHPVVLGYPESFYLKCAILRAL